MSTAGRVGIILVGLLLVCFGVVVSDGRKLRGDGRSPRHPGSPGKIKGAQIPESSGGTRDSAPTPESGSVCGRIVDRNGAGIEGALVTIVQAVGSRVRSTRSVASGEFTVRDLSALRRCEVVVSHASYASSRLLSYPTPRSLLFVMNSGRSISGSVESVPSQLPFSCKVVAESAAGRQTAPVDSSGQWTLRRATADPLRLSIEGELQHTVDGRQHWVDAKSPYVSVPEGAVDLAIGTPLLLTPKLSKLVVQLRLGDGLIVKSSNLPRGPVLGGDARLDLSGGRIAVRLMRALPGTAIALEVQGESGWRTLAFPRTVPLDSSEVVELELSRQRLLFQLQCEPSVSLKDATLVVYLASPPRSDLNVDLREIDLERAADGFVDVVVSATDQAVRGTVWIPHHESIENPHWSPASPWRVVVAPIVPDRTVLGRCVDRAGDGVPGVLVMGAYPTDADGAFNIQVESTEKTIWGRKSGVGWFEVQAPALEDAAGRIGTVKLEPPLQASLTIRDEHGKELAGVRCLSRANDPVISDAVGAISILLYSADGEDAEFDAPGRGYVRQRIRAGLASRVTLEREGRVHLLLHELSSAHCELRLRSERGLLVPVRWAWEASLCDYVLSELPPGRIEIVARGPTGIPVGRASVLVKPGGLFHVSLR